MRYLLTGGRGFIGRRLEARLREREPHADIICLGSDTDLTRKDVASAAFRACGSVDYVIHLADVQRDARWSAVNSLSQYLANSYMALNVLSAWAAHQAGARIVALSSLWAYPAAAELAAEDGYWNGRLHAATEHYGISKKLFGVGIAAAGRELGLRGTTLVLGSVYGPHDSTSHVIPSLIRRMRDNPARLEIRGDGSQARDFIYVDDQVEGIVRHMDYGGELLNISSGTLYSIREVVETLVRLTKYSGRLEYSGGDDGAARNRQLDISLARRTTGWPGDFALRSLEAGLIETLAALD